MAVERSSSPDSWREMAVWICASIVSADIGDGRIGEGVREVAAVSEVML